MRTALPPSQRRAFAHACEQCRRSVFTHDITLTRSSAKGEPWKGICSDEHAFECEALAQSSQPDEVTA